MTSIIQPTFANGVIAPSLFGRVDTSAYYNSLKEGINFIVRPYGGVDNRPGTKFIVQAKDKKCRLIPFQFSKDQTYVLEFGDKYVRICTRGGQILDTSGSPISVETPYLSEDLFELKYTQSADVLTLVHEDYPVQQLKRYAEDDWKLEPYQNKNGPFEDINVDESITVSTSDVVDDITLSASQDLFTEDMVDTFFYIEQSNVDNVPVWETDKTVKVGTERRAGYNYYVALTPGKTGSLRPAHTEGAMFDGSTGDTGVQWQYLHSGSGIVLITSVDSSTEAKGRVVSRLPSSVSNGSVSIWQNHATTTVINTRNYHRVYNSSTEAFEWVLVNTETSSSTKDDSGWITISGNPVPTYKWAKAVWRKDNGYPSTVSFYKQRLFFAASRAYPQTVWSTETGDYSSFIVSNPTLDTDSINFTHADAQLNKIQHLMDIGQLITLTASGEYRVGSSSEALTPSTFMFSKQGANGASGLMPIMVNDTALYVQNKNGVVRSIGYTFETDGYQSSDLTIFANHYFRNHQIVDWAFITYPYSAAFCVRDDGVLLCLTYVKEQQVVGWTELHTIGGEFKSVSVISEGAEDVLYCAVERIVDGEARTYIEKMASRLFENQYDYFFVDSGLTYDGRNTDDKVHINISALTGWEVGNKVTVTFSEEISSLTEDDEIHIPYTEGETKRKLILRSVYGEKDIYTPESNIPKDLQDVAISNFGIAKKRFKGLEHINNEEVSVLGDGAVTEQVKVTDGTIELNESYVVVTAGLPIEGRLQTLSVNMSGSETLLDKNKLITDVTLIVESSRGFWCGQSLDRMYEYPQRRYEHYDENVTPATGAVEVKLNAGWDKNGSVYIVQKDPLPLSVLSVIPNVTIGGR